MITNIEKNQKANPLILLGAQMITGAVVHGGLSHVIGKVDKAVETSASQVLKDSVTWDEFKRGRSSTDVVRMLWLFEWNIATFHYTVVVGSQGVKSLSTVHEGHRQGRK
jgi:hypothetical protein